MTFATRLRRIALWKKFTFLGLLYLAVIAVPITLYWGQVDKVLEFSAKEREGLPQAHLMLNIIQRTQQHRALSARFLEGIDTPIHERRSKAEELESAIFAYEVYFDKHPNQVLRDEFARMVGVWHELHRKVSQKKLNGFESFDLHVALIAEQLQYLQMIIDTYQLNLDQDAASYFLIEAGLVQLPELTEMLGQIRGLGVGFLARGGMTSEERAQLNALLLMSQAKMKNLNINVDKASVARINDQGTIADNYQAIKTQHQKIVDLTQREILSKEQLSYASEEFYAAFTLGLNSYFAYAHFTVDQLDSMLNARITESKNTLFVQLVIVFLFVLLVALIAISFVRNILRQLGGDPHYATEVVQAITRGDLDYDIETQRPDSLLAGLATMQQKLRENDRLKSDFISRASHEFRTPLTAISGALSLSVSGQLGELPESAIKVLEIAQKNSLRLTELVNDLLDVNSLSIGKLELDLQIQPLMPIIDDACLSMTSYAHKYGAHIVVGPRYEYLLVKVDARRLRQVLVNFISNAAKFSPKGEEIMINVNVSFDKVKVEVIDHGCGIPESRHATLFQKMLPEEASHSDSTGGGGLGLAIAKELIELMNGAIGFVSTEGVGSCFYVELPLEEANSD
jgi:signal transduction histidine kinase